MNLKRALSLPHAFSTMHLVKEWLQEGCRERKGWSQSIIGCIATPLTTTTGDAKCPSSNADNCDLPYALASRHLPGAPMFVSKTVHMVDQRQQHSAVPADETEYYYQLCIVLSPQFILQDNLVT